MPSASSGKIITFCSYRGGTGQSMSLANIAWILASNGCRVLAIDWNLEAPGLHRYFYPFLVDKSLAASDGLIDFFIDFTIEAMTPVLQNEDLSQGWDRKRAEIDRYAVSLDWPFPSGGGVDFVPAGRQSPFYPTRVSSFSWVNFYDRLGGAAFIETAKEKMRAAYDYILIDSQAGLSEASETCTVKMPDTLVVCYTLQGGSIDGSAAIAHSVYEQRKNSGVNILPVPMRVENAERELQVRVSNYARHKFANFPTSLSGESRERYWAEVGFPAIPLYSFGEMLAVFIDWEGVLNSILASAERLTNYITEGQVTRFINHAPESAQSVLAQYDEQFTISNDATSEPPVILLTTTAQPTDQSDAPFPVQELAQSGFEDEAVHVTRIFVSYSHNDKKFLDDDSLLGYLKGLENEGVKFWWDDEIATGDKWDDEIRNKIKKTDIALTLVSEWFLNSAYIQKVEITEFLRESENNGLSIFPIMLSPCDWEQYDWLKSRKFMPEGNKTFKEHFDKAHKRERFFLQVKLALRKQIEAKQQAANGNSEF
jgi:TIR domain-containing protein